MIPQHEAFRGTLNSAHGLYGYCKWVSAEELTALLTKLMFYAHLGYNLNPADAQFNEMCAKLEGES